MRRSSVNERTQQADKGTEEGIGTCEITERSVPGKQRGYRRGILQYSRGGQQLGPLSLPSSASASHGTASPCAGCYSPQLPARIATRFMSSFAALILSAVILLTPGSLNGGSIGGLYGITLANGALCFPNATSKVETVDVSADSDIDLTSYFNCSNGEFEVTWRGSVEVNGTIWIGVGTKVSIVGDYGNGLRIEDYAQQLMGSKYDNGGMTSTSQAESGVSEVIAGSSFGSIFFVGNGTLDLKNMTLRGGNATNAPPNEPNVITYGGGVTAYYSTLTVTGCHFEDMFTDYWGGGVFGNGSQIVVRNSLFKRCNAGLRSSPGDDDESVQGAGGGLALWGERMFVDNCVFEECYASRKGGAIQHSVGGVTVSNSTFWKNSAGSTNEDDEDSFWGEGGDFSTNQCDNGFEGSDGVCLFHNCKFYHSRVGKKGAVMMVGKGNLYPNRTSHVEFNLCFVYNASCGMYFEDDPQGEGAGVALSEKQKVTIRNSEFLYNKAGKKGAVILLSSGKDFTDEPGGEALLINSNFTGNKAHGGDGGVVYLNTYSNLTISGNSNRFISNSADEQGGVVGATDNTVIHVDGGHYSKNEGKDSGGVIQSRGTVTILGGEYVENDASEGGVFAASSNSIFTVQNGNFHENSAGSSGGVASVGKKGKLEVHGGTYKDNESGNGGVFSSEEGGDIMVMGGNYTKNSADFGGFLYKKGSGITNCSDALVQENTGLDGGALYITDAEVHWQCNLIGNDALVAPAIYARDKSNVDVKNVNITDNIVSRGSVVFLVSSELTTYEVGFQDAGTNEVSAVQVDKSSTYIAERTVFRGFNKETVVYSEGTLNLDNCDFSESSSSVLVLGQQEFTTVRNAILGDVNYNQSKEDAKTLGEFPLVSLDSSASVKCEDSEDSSLCSKGSTCMNGDLGVFCQCYTGSISENEICSNTDAGEVQLKILESTEVASFSSFVEVPDLNLQFSGEDNAFSSFMRASTSSTGNVIGSDVGVVWDASMFGHGADMVDWMIFPSRGLLLPGRSVTLWLVGKPSPQYDGKKRVNVNVAIMGSSALEHEQSIVHLEKPINTTYYHCEGEKYWDIKTEECIACSELEEASASLKCSEPGVSIKTLPLVRGYWRANLTTTKILQCLNQTRSGNSGNYIDSCAYVALALSGSSSCRSKTGSPDAEGSRRIQKRMSQPMHAAPATSTSPAACKGGSIVKDVNDYCSKGYEGPYCAVCSTGFGRGVSNACHECTKGFRGGMYFVLALAGLLIITVGIFLAIYLVGGTDAVASTVDRASESVRTLQRRTSGVLAPLIPAAASSSTESRTRSSPTKSPSMDATGRDLDLPRSFFSGILHCASHGSTLSTSYPRRRTFDEGRNSNIGVLGFDGASANHSSEAEGKAVSPLQSKTPADKTEAESNSEWEIFDLSANRGGDISKPDKLRGDLGDIESSLGANVRQGTDCAGSYFPPLDSEADINRITSSLPGSRYDSLPAPKSGNLATSSPAQSHNQSLPKLMPRDSAAREGAIGTVVASQFSSRCEAKDDEHGSRRSGHVPGAKAVLETESGYLVPSSGEQKDSMAGDDGRSVVHPDMKVTMMTPSSGRSGGVLHAARAVEAAPVAIVKQRRDDGTEKKLTDSKHREAQKRIAAKVRALLAKLPFSKLKIVIVVWQITSAFADITQVLYPPVYKRFLEVISLFTFDLGWIVSASCLASGITFYDKLIIMTIGPMVLFCILGITFYIGLQQLATKESGHGDRTRSSRQGPRTVRSGAIDETRKSDRTAIPSDSNLGRKSETDRGEHVQVLRRSQQSLQTVWAHGPGGAMDDEQNRRWRLFARHTTVSLIILYLVYGHISTVVFRTFSCVYFEETREHYLWADFRIKCNTTKHYIYMVYAAGMIVVYPFGIPAAFWYFLNRQRSRINPKVHKGSSDSKSVAVSDTQQIYITSTCTVNHKNWRLWEKKMEVRSNDETVSPTSFLWAAYLPDRYYYEVIECMRRLLLMGLLVFMMPDSAEQVALGCIFSIVSLMTFELLRPHADNLDLQLYRAGSLVILFSNFLALLIKAKVTQPESGSNAVYSAILVAVNVLFFLSMWWNTYASVKILLKTKRVEESLLGVDIVPEEKMDKEAILM